MGAINCPLLEGSRTFPLPWNLRRTPCYWMVSRASPLCSLGLATHGLKNRRLNHEKGRGFLSLTELMPATRLLGAKRSAHQKYTPAKNEQVRSIYLWQHVPIYVYHWSSTCAESTEKKHSRSPGLVHPHQFRRSGWR